MSWKTCLFNQFSKSLIKLISYDYDLRNVDISFNQIKEEEGKKILSTLINNSYIMNFNIENNLLNPSNFDKGTEAEFKNLIKKNCFISKYKIY